MARSYFKYFEIFKNINNGGPSQLLVATISGNLPDHLQQIRQ